MIYLYLLKIQHFTIMLMTIPSFLVEEGGTHLRIDIWHLLKNLKNNYLLKKTVEVAQKNNIELLIFTMLYFLKKNKEKHLKISLF